ncbi:SAM-dependent methyltransferase [Nocardia jiangxiensis]|uniref:SAM-dependent methyltransferase n=1 Tax=Nocardia jiangxiensis TaxID=282685 RepID=UPI000312CC72|nr:SAM-dependent methyltransferase [Nocardia jiangxiensis]
MPDGDADGRLPTTIDTTVAHEARVYDYWLGGVDNYPADRTLGNAIAAHIPGIRSMARANRVFLGRSVRYAITELGITQFLDIGTGLPTARNTHQVAQEVDRTARIVYVDKDPLVLAHARALMKGSPVGRTAFIHADLLDSEAILRDPRLTDTLDLERPIAIMLISVLMYFHDADGIHDVVSRLLNGVAPGSSLAISHFTGDFNASGAAQAADAAARGGLTLVARNQSEVENLFAGTDLVPPWVSTLEDWHPELGEDLPYDAEPHVGPAWAWAGMGRKP